MRVAGGFTEHQFEEQRLPTLAELNAVAPDTPVFLLHLDDRALLSAAALRAVGFTRDTPEPPVLPDWSPVKRFGGYAAGGDAEGVSLQAALRRQAAAGCGCARTRGVQATRTRGPGAAACRWRLARIAGTSGARWAAPAGRFEAEAGDRRKHEPRGIRGRA